MLDIFYLNFFAVSFLDYYNILLIIREDYQLRLKNMD